MSKGIPLPAAMLVAQSMCTVRCVGKPACLYAQRHCPTLWQRAFVLRYGTQPTGDDDPRWNTFYKEGSVFFRTTFLEMILAEATL